MISIRTFSGQPFQTIHVTEDDTTYNDLLKYIKIPPHPRFEKYDRDIFTDYIVVKPYIKLFHTTNEVKLNDIIDFDSELIIGFYFQYYYCDFDDDSDNDNDNDDDDDDYYYVKFSDDFNLPDTSTYDKCKTLIEICPYNIIFINNKTWLDELCKLAIRLDGRVLQYVKEQTEEICKLAVRKNGLSLRWGKIRLLNINYPNP